MCGKVLVQQDQALVNLMAQRVQPRIGVCAQHFANGVCACVVFQHLHGIVHHPLTDAVRVHPFVQRVAQVREPRFVHPFGVVFRLKRGVKPVSFVSSRFVLPRALAQFFAPNAVQIVLRQFQCGVQFELAVDRCVGERHGYNLARQIVARGGCLGHNCLDLGIHICALRIFHSKCSCPGQLVPFHPVALVHDDQQLVRQRGVLCGDVAYEL